MDKPAGLLTVPGKAEGLADCLEARVQALWPEALLLHRLDMDTSGIVLFARDAKARRHVARQFQFRTLKKVYTAVVAGCPPPKGRVDLPLICDWPRRPLQKVCHTRGKPSITDWEVVERSGDRARLRLMPLTGRSHQIRVHLMSLGHPILGDRFYAPGPLRDAAPRLLLHATDLSLRHPDGGDWLTVTSAVPF